MEIAFCLFKYFPFGGLQRDFMNIALECQSRGHTIRVYCTQWQGSKPEGFTLITLPKKGLSNHARLRNFDIQVNRHLKQHPADRVVGFTKMHGLDFYYAAEGCNAEKGASEKGPFYRMMSRHKTHILLESAVFHQRHHTEILTLAPQQHIDFKKHYGTSDQRFHMLPPGISLQLKYHHADDQSRQSFRQQHAIPQDHLLLLQVGSDFKRKGVDRSLSAIAHLPPILRDKVTYFVVGQDDPAPFNASIEKYGLTAQVRFFPGRDDIPEFMHSADLLLHPAYHEAAGIVILEALAAGLPVLVTENCGYAFHVKNSGAGDVCQIPYRQENFDHMLESALSNKETLRSWAEKARYFSDHSDIYSLPQRAADLITAERID